MCKGSMLLSVMIFLHVPFQTHNSTLIIMECITCIPLCYGYHLGSANEKDLQIQGILVSSGCYNKNTTNWVAYKQKTFIFHSSKGWDI